MRDEFDLEERARTKVEEAARSIKLQWDAPAFDGKILLLVENTNDKKCYFKLFNPKKVEIRITKGCNSMKHLFDAIQLTGVPNFAIQDSDFARVCGCEPVESNYFLSDCHDHEMMCLKNDEILKSLFANQALEYDTALVDEIFDDLKILSNFKWYNYHYRAKVNFEGYKIRGHSKEELRSFEAIYNYVKPQSPNCSLTIKEYDVTSFVDSQPKQSRFELTNGHDFLDQLARGIGEKIENPNLKTDELRIVMYACFTKEYFIKTQLYKHICTWAGENSDTLFAA